MPRVPWTAISAISPETECVVVTTQARLRHRRDLPRFAASSQTLWSHLQSADGLIGYELRASIRRGTLSTVSAWRDRDTMLAFTHGAAHQQVVEKTRKLTTDNRIRSWVSSGQQLLEHQMGRPLAEPPRSSLAGVGFRGAGDAHLSTPEGK